MSPPLQDGETGFGKSAVVLLLSDRAEIHHIQNGVDLRVSQTVDLHDMKRYERVFQIDIGINLRTILHNGERCTVGGGMAPDRKGADISYLLKDLIAAGQGAVGGIVEITACSDVCQILGSIEADGESALVKIIELILQVIGKKLSFFLCIYKMTQARRFYPAGLRVKKPGLADGNNDLFSACQCTRS